MLGQAVSRPLVDLVGHDRPPLVLDHVPGLQPAVRPAGEEERGSGGTPAAVRQHLSAGVDPEQAALGDVLGPHPGTPVPDSQEVLERDSSDGVTFSAQPYLGVARVPLERPHGSVVRLVGGEDVLGLTLRLPRAPQGQALLRPHHELGRDGRLVLQAAEGGFRKKIENNGISI